MTPKEINKLRLMSKLKSNIPTEKLRDYFCVVCKKVDICTGIKDEKNKISFEECFIFTCFESDARAEK